jgi:hypothetical protein
VRLDGMLSSVQPAITEPGGNNMQQAKDDSYQTMVNILAELVRGFLSSTPRQETPREVSRITFLRVSVLLQQEDEDWADFELTAELLGTRDFKRLA